MVSSVLLLKIKQFFEIIKIYDCKKMVVSIGGADGSSF